MAPYFSRSIKITAEQDRIFAENPEINVSRICREALDKYIEEHGLR